MKNAIRETCAATALLGAVSCFFSPIPAAAQSSDALVFGFKVQAGGRWDNVRMCVATPAGAKGGPAFDVSLFAEIGMLQNTSLVVDLPVMRPALFALAFDMLQFEPTVSLHFRQPTSGAVDFIVGPSLGATLHYGPDYQSGSEGAERGPSFFALGPRFGGYFGLDFKRPGELFNFQLGAHPYFSPLIAVGDPADHCGAVLGGMLEGTFRFSTHD
jgi:hypothetical protein